MKQKYTCLLYRTKTTEQEDQAEMERQRGACLQFAQEQGWLPIREFWCSEEDGRPTNEDPLLELRAGAEQAQFQIKNSIFRNSLIFQGLPPIKYQNLMYFPLFLPL